VFGHASPISGGTDLGGSTNVNGQNISDILYRLEISALQEPGHYQNRLMYIGTATF
jgi:hypothetical protein